MLPASFFNSVGNHLPLNFVYPPSTIHSPVHKCQYMKKSFCFVLFCALFLQIMPATAAAPQHDPEVKVIVTPRRIWLVADEIPVHSLQVRVFDATGKVVLERKFSSKTADWSLDLAALPTGRYSVVAGTQEPIRFHK